MSSSFQKWNGTNWVGAGGEIGGSFVITRYERVVVNEGFSSLTIFSDIVAYRELSGKDLVRIVDGEVLVFEGNLRSGGELKSDRTSRFTIKVKGWNVSKQKSSVDLTSTTVNNIMSSSFAGSSISLNTTNSTNFNIGRYIFSGRRVSIWEENTYNYQKKLLFFGTDTAFLEDLGATSSGLVIDTSNTPSKIKRWQKEVVDDLVTEVETFSVDNNGVKISQSVGSGDEFLRRQVPYARTNQELLDVANSLLKTNNSEGGVVKIVLDDFGSFLVNQTVVLKDVTNSIDSEFVVLKQRDFYPEKSTELVIGYDEQSRGVKNDNKKDSDLVDERSKIEGESGVDVGNQDGSGNTANHNHDAQDVFGHEHLVDTNTADNTEITEFLASGSGGSSLSPSSGWVTLVNLNFSSTPTDIVFVQFEIDVVNDGTSNIVFYQIREGNRILYEDILLGGSAFTGERIIRAFPYRLVASINNINLRVRNNTSASGVGLDASVSVSRSVINHNHVVPSQDSDEEQANVTDFNRNPSVSVSTNEKNVDVGRVFKINRE